MKILYDNDKPLWRSRVVNNIQTYSCGDESSVNLIISFLQDAPNWRPETLAALLEKTIGHYGLIAADRNFVIAVADTVCSHPIFYTTDTVPSISCSPAILAKQALSAEINLQALHEFIMSGYTWGTETVYKQIRRLQAGEFIYCNKKTSEFKPLRYYRYYPIEPKCRENEKNLIERLDAVLDSVIKRTISKANGTPIWIPLSGGLDSRAILCKLHQAGYDKIFTFSYGPHRNREAEIAKIAAESLGVPWFFAPPPGRKSARESFSSETRKKYWDFAETFSSIPTMQDLLPLIYLRKNGLLQEDAAIINGQTGDFISGGHIPINITDANFDAAALYGYIAKKHFGIWKSLQYPEIIQQQIKRISELFPTPPNTEHDPPTLAAIYEEIEWQGRQCRYVINGQRVYDYLALKWQLPLWDLEFMDFWQSVPLEFRLNSKLWKTYLGAYDYKGLFTRPLPPHKTFPVRFGKLLGGFVDITSKLGLQTDKFCAIFSQYGNYYAMFTLSEYFKTLHRAVTPPYARGVMALTIRQWLRERNISCQLSKKICPE